MDVSNDHMNPNVLHIITISDEEFRYSVDEPLIQHKKRHTGTAMLRKWVLKSYVMYKSKIPR